MSYACVRQHDQSDCGAAALASVALHYRVPLGLQQMRDLAGTDRVGTNMLGLLHAAESLGFKARGVKGPYEALRDVRLPAVAHWVTEDGFGHFVVLHRVRARGVVIADPARGVRKLAREEFAKLWTGHLLLLEPRDLPRPEDRPAAPVRPWRRLAALLRPHASILGEAFLCAILLTVLAFSTSFFIQHLVDSVLVHGQGRLLNALAIGMGVLLVFRGAFGALRQYLLAHVSRKVDMALISGYARHVLGLPMNFFEMRRTGEILSRVNDAVKVRQAISGTVLGGLVDATLVALSMALMIACDWRLAAVAGAFIPAFLLAVGAHHPSTRRLSRQAMEDAARLQSHLIEDIGGVDTVKAYRSERRRAEEGEEHLFRTLSSVFSLQLLNVSMGTLGTLMAASAGLAILWYGGHRAIEGTLSIGQLMFFYSLLGIMLQPLERLASVNLQLQDALVAVDRLGEILDLETEKPHEGGKAELTHVRDGIRLEGVSFRYGCRAEVLKKVDAEIPAGSTVAIVGESGCGKTTLLKLLMRFHDPTEGRITLDGIDLRDHSLASVRSAIGYVSQDPYIFNGTVRDNIALAKPGAPMEEIAAAARAAQLEEFITSLPQRYDTVIGERGANLSGGQRQRLAIARIVLARPEVVVFDEATSHLDTATERALRNGLKTALSGRTVILVAHRMSTVRDAHLIYVMHEGRIVEHGTHRELVAAGGRYFSLWQSQEEDGHEPVVMLDEEQMRSFAGPRNGNGKALSNVV